VVTAGVHIAALGGGCPGKTELDPRSLERAGVFVELGPQTRIKGELQNIPDPFRVTEFWRVLLRRASGRVSDPQITVFDSVGFAIEDFSALRYARDALDATGLYEQIGLVAGPVDPKDLFGVVGASSPVLTSQEPPAGPGRAYPRA
jgi:ornithine cyclodeaminase